MNHCLGGQGRWAARGTVIFTVQLRYLDMHLPTSWGDLRGHIDSYCILLRCRKYSHPEVASVSPEVDQIDPQYILGDTRFNIL